ncbi:MAG: transcriptional regulator, partial [Propionibacteriaceae bacterium]|nr:transcriptional regulator [Propionibacteriaceae bacterium]
PRRAALELGHAWGSNLGDPPGGLLGVLARQGFTPRPTPEGILLQTCPLLEVARRNPEVVCSIHQGLIDATSGSPAELVPFATTGACLIRV